MSVLDSLDPETLDEVLTLSYDKAARLGSRPNYRSYLRAVRNPLAVVPPKTPEEVSEAITEYFEACFDNEVRPSLGGLALALGLPSISGIERLGQRQPNLRWMLGRALVAIQHGYELLIGKVSAQGLMYVLNNIPDGFDEEEPPGSPSLRFWASKQEVMVRQNITALIARHTLGDDVTPDEAYMRLIEGEVVHVPDSKIPELVPAEVEEAVEVSEPDVYAQLMEGDADGR